MTTITPQRLAQINSSYQTRKFNDLSKREVDQARKFAAQFGETLSQAAKYFDYIEAYKDGFITAAELTEVTGLVDQTLPPPAPEPTPASAAEVAAIDVVAVEPAPAAGVATVEPTPAPDFDQMLNDAIVADYVESQLAIGYSDTVAEALEERHAFADADTAAYARGKAVLEAHRVVYTSRNTALVPNTPRKAVAYRVIDAGHVATSEAVRVVALVPRANA